MRILVLTVAAMGFASSSNAQPPVTWGGVYKFRHTIGMAYDEAANAENILEIVPVGPAKFYVRIESWSHNAHRCKFYGVSELLEGSLNYHGPLEEFVDARPNPTPPPTFNFETTAGRCELKITRVREGGNEMLVLNDPGDRCQQKLCGANGYFKGVSWDAKSRREIRYMDRLKASPEYHTALEEAGLKPAQ